ncbi:MAG: serine aminopeptidase domain-containing protein [Bryobacteraceae bacterium]
MKTLSNFPYTEVEFDMDGKPVDPRETQDLMDYLAGDGKELTDLFIMSHGWNNDMNDARGLYARFFAVLRGVLDQTPPSSLAGRRFGVVGILWPSKKFADADLIPGGAAAFDPDSALQDSLDHLKTFFTTDDARAKIDEAKALADRLDEGEPARDAWFAKIRALLPARGQDSEDASEQFLAIPGSDLLRKLQAPIAPALSPGSGFQGGGAAGFGDFFGSVQSAAIQALNYTTYYLMKDRAGVVGRAGVCGLISEIANHSPGLKIHLIGHSFGGRVVTSAADASASKVSGMTLLQAAFSHYSFAHNYEPGSDGLFREVVTDGKVTGPILISHSMRDTAVGKAYAIASAIAGQIAQALGDENDRYGGLGRNGARLTPEAVDGNLQAVGSTYQFTGGKIFNLTADDIIMEHSDICKPEVAYALLSAVAAASPA